MRRYLLAWSLLICVSPAAFAQDEGKVSADERPTKELLTPDSFGKLHTLILPEAGEYRWDEIGWFASIWHARRKAAAEDKPIFILGTAGAGFNDPLGNC